MAMELQESIKDIYEKLEDETSREIFASRLLYSLTGDHNYILEIVRKTEEGSLVFDKLKNCNKKKVIFGAGVWGKNIVNAYKATVFECFVDNKASVPGSLYYGLPVVPFNEMKGHLCGGGYLIIISSRLYHEQIYGQLLEMGVEDENIVDVGGLIDGMSQRQYFDLPALRERTSAEEVFVDGGCFDGKTSQRFIQWCGGRFNKIYAFEPDPDNLTKCAQALGEYTDQYKIISKGLWDTTEELRFDAIANGSSKISDDGSVKIQVTSLDEAVTEKVTFLKLDIEGSEYRALLGACKIISQQKPKLAISIYHKPEDIWKLPALLLELNPDYRFYLRHYSIAASETVLYAI